MGRRDRESVGILLGISAYSIWGIAPLYWQILIPAKPMEVLAHRVVWSLLLLAALVWARGRMPYVRQALRDRRTARLMVAASILIGLNWGLFIWATMSGYVLDAALGYYTVPLLSVALGVLVLKERLRPLQWLAIAIAACSVVYVTVDNGSLPWIGLALAGTWAIYGFVKKRAGVDAIESLVIESGLIAPLALAYLWYLHASGQGSFGAYGVTHALGLAGSGVFTAAPLLLFGAAVVRTPLSTLGFMQYISSSIQFVLGVWVFDEAMSAGRFVGFAITWVALAILTFDSVRSRRGLPPTAIVEPD